MFNFIREYLETHSVRSDRGLARRERRYARREMRDYEAERKMAELIDKRFEEGTRQKIQDAFVKYQKIIMREIGDLRELIVGYKTLLRRTFDELAELEQEIKGNPNERQREQALQMLRKMEQEIEKNYQSYFQSLTSFDSINLSAKNLLDRASQIRDLFYHARELRGPVSDFKKALSAAHKAERAGTQDIDIMGKLNLASDALHKELERHAKGITDVILLLQQIKATVEREEQMVIQMRDHKNYPRVWTANNIATLTQINDDLHRFIEQETTQARLFMSREEHRKAA